MLYVNRQTVNIIHSIELLRRNFILRRVETSSRASIGETNLYTFIDLKKIKM